MSEDFMKDYLKAINDYEAMSAEEETEMFKRMKSGDMEAREKIIHSNLKFVVKIALEYKDMGVSLEDLVMVGNIGLMNAIEKFDYTLGYKFNTYAVYYIRLKIRRELNKFSHVVTINDAAISKFKKVTKLKEEYGDDIDKISEEIKMKNYNKIKHLVNNGYSQISLNITDEEGKHEIMDTIVNENDFYASFEKKDLIDVIIKNYKSILNKKEIFVFEKIYGINCKRHTQNEIAEMLGIKRQRVQQMGKEILRKMKNLVLK